MCKMQSQQNGIFFARLEHVCMSVCVCVCVYLVGQDAVQEEFPKENMKTLALLKHQK